MFLEVAGCRSEPASSRESGSQLGPDTRIGSGAAIAHRQCRLIWLILHQGVRYEERGPAVTKQSKQRRTTRIIRQTRSLGYRIDPPNPQTQRSTSALIFDSVAQERQPGRAIGVLSRPVVMSENPANHVFVDWDVERQGDLWAIRGQPQLGLRCFISTTA